MIFSRYSWSSPFAPWSVHRSENALCCGTQPLHALMKLKCRTFVREAWAGPWWAERLGVKWLPALVRLRLHHQKNHKRWLQQVQTVTVPGLFVSIINVLVWKLVIPKLDGFSSCFSYLEMKRYARKKFITCPNNLRKAIRISFWHIFPWPDGMSHILSHKMKVTLHVSHCGW